VGGWGGGAGGRGGKGGGLGVWVFGVLSWVLVVRVDGLGWLGFGRMLGFCRWLGGCVVYLGVGGAVGVGLFLLHGGGGGEAMKTPRKVCQPDPAKNIKSEAADSLLGAAMARCKGGKYPGWKSPRAGDKRDLRRGKKNIEKK